MKNLTELAQEETDTSVKWNPYNGVVQSHVTGEQYLSVRKAEEYVKSLNDETKTT